MRLPALLAASCLLAPPALAIDKIYQNDSITDGASANVQAGFVKNEIAASVFTVPVLDGTIFLRKAQVMFFNALGQSTSRQGRILVYASGAVNPGVPVYTSPIVTFIPGFLNEVDVSPGNLEFTPGQSFTIGLKFEQEGLLVNFSSIVTDTNGILAQKNRVFAVPGGWVTAESLGITGDFGIRAAVTVLGPAHYGAGSPGTLGVPTLDTFGAWKVGNAAFGFSGTLGAPSGTAALAISPASGILFIQGITLLVDGPSAIGLFTPTNASGTWSLTTGIPGDPLLAGVHVYCQALFVDFGAAQGISASDAIDLQIAAP